MALARAADAPTAEDLPAMMITQGGAYAGDSLGKAWWWNVASFAVDDGSEFATVILPDNMGVLDPGRWEQTSLG